MVNSEQYLAILDNVESIKLPKAPKQIVSINPDSWLAGWLAGQMDARHRIIQSLKELLHE